MLWPAGPQTWMCWSRAEQLFGGSDASPALLPASDILVLPRLQPPAQKQALENALSHADPVVQPKLNGQPAAIGTQTSAGKVMHSVWDPGALLTVSIKSPWGGSATSGASCGAWCSFTSAQLTRAHSAR